MKNSILTLGLLITTTGFIFGQEKQKSGVVLDQNNKPLQNAVVKLNNTSQEVVTDAAGAFSIQISDTISKPKLAISHDGYINKTVDIANQENVKITLQPNPDDKTKNIEEVVIIAYGTQKKGEVTGSVGRVNAESFKNRPIARVDQALTGQIAGVKTRATSGKPGEPLEVRVRGTASISASNSPLYVVDGMVVDDMANVSPDDVQSIEVLKDAASTAMYGSRGSNGVVIVTTKKGTSGKPSFSFSQYYGVQTIEKKLDVMSSAEWIDYASEAINKKWVALNPAVNSASDSYEVRANYFNLANTTNYNLANVNYMVDPRWGTNQVANIDWQDAFYRPATIQSYQLSVRGGSKNSKYVISGAYFDQEGLALNTGFNRFNLSAVIDVNISDKWKAGISVRPSYSQSYGAAVDGKDNEAHKMLSMVPIAELSAGLYTNFWKNDRYRWASSSQSSIGVLENTTNETNEFRILSSLYMSYDILPSLNLKISGGATNNFNLNNSYTPTFNLITNIPGQVSIASRRTINYNRYLGEGLLSYKKSFGDHNVSAIAGYSAENYRTTSQYNRNKGFPNDDLKTFNFTQSASVLNSEYTASEWMLISMFGRVNYDYKKKYMLSASIRRDGSSRFGWDNLYGTFPAFGAAWKIDEEEFLKNSKLLSNLKLRYSWGETGNNNIGEYRAFGTLAGGNYSFGGNLSNGLVPNTIRNPNLTWEKTQSSDFGLELGLFNRIDFTADYYIKKTNDLLLQQPVPLTTGYNIMWKNVGSVENKGLELDLSTRNLTGAFKWNTSANIAFNNNKVLALGANNAPIYTGFSSLTNIIQVGEQLNSFYLYEAIGVLSTADINNTGVAKTTGAIAGDVKYKDVNGDGVINENDRHIIGGPTPDYYWGFTNTFSYKNFDLSVFFQGQKGGYSYALLGRAIDRTGMGTTTNVMGNWANRWRSDEDPGDGKTPRLDGTTGSLLDTRWLYDATYIQLKNVTLGYSFDQELASKLNISNLRIYVSLENVWRKDHYYGGYNPESVQSDGTDYGAYPNAKVYMMGLNFNF
ncbi:TonB-linked SusC/RagA family outer membrane protein [Chryseobacterium ginsenosidimutans]|uniref:SusC/RagA family TonB-linked outer membrane protein n=1 Tax=Chryseobacterium ginsenosidimutans TaxID=687846 RepID=UPI002788E7E5|nr:TonB-dependent receptor [Chryseobacterium ginsenosidimutans]MDQ0595051.1 TonB-linked SusC/RagA family outer membrane protein [Chryseobacterium ginsenosidimutans]